MLTSHLHTLGIFVFTLAWIAYDHYPPWVNFHSEALALLGIGLLALSRSLRVDRCVALAPRIVWWVWGTTLIPWMQYFFDISLFSGDAWLASFYLCGLATSIWLGFSYSVFPMEPQSGLIPLFYALWIGAFASAALGLMQWLNLQNALEIYALQTDAGDRAMGNLGQPNQLASLLLIGMAALAWTFERRRINHIGLVFGVAFLTLVLVLTQSRAGMISALVMAIFLLWKNCGNSVRLPPRWVLIWLLAYGATVLLLPSFSEVLLMGGSRTMNPGIDPARVTIWKQVLNGIALSPWWGYGWNETPTAHAAASLAVPGSIMYTNAHNVVLDLLAWNGVPLGLLLTGTCGYWFVTRMRQATQSNSVYAMVCLLPIAVHSLVEYPFAYSYFLVTAGLMVGIVEASQPSVQIIQLKMRVVGLALAVWFMVGSYMAYEYLLIEEDFRVVRFENLSVGQTPTDYQIPKIRMLSHMGSMLKAARQQALPGMTADELENLRKSSLRFPYSNLGLRNALAMGLNGDPDGATRQMAVIRGMYGEQYYHASVRILRQIQKDNYSELAQIVTP